MSLLTARNKAAALLDSDLGQRLRHWRHWPEAAVGAATLASGVLLLELVHKPLFALGFVLFAALLCVAVALHARSRGAAEAEGSPDWRLLRAAVDSPEEAVAITTAEGALLCAGDLFTRWFGGARDPAAYDATLSAAAVAARRDGEATVSAIIVPGQRLSGRITRAGDDDLLVWRFWPTRDVDLSGEALRLIAGGAGDRLGEAGVMVALVRGDGMLLGANRAFEGRNKPY